MTLGNAIKNFEQEIGEFEGLKKIRAITPEDYGRIEKTERLAEWLKILQLAKFEYDEAWRTITHPTPDVTYADKQRAQVILDTFRNSLGATSPEQTDIEQAAKLLSDFIESCPGGDSYLITPDGEELRTDWGYALDGVQLIYEWAKNRSKE